MGAVMPISKGGKLKDGGAERIPRRRPNLA